MISGPEGPETPVNGGSGRKKRYLYEPLLTSMAQVLPSLIYCTVNVVAHATNLECANRMINRFFIGTNF